MTASIRAGGPDCCNLTIQSSHVCGKDHIFNAESLDIRLASALGLSWRVRRLGAKGVLRHAGAKQFIAD